MQGAVLAPHGWVGAGLLPGYAPIACGGLMDVGVVGGDGRALQVRHNRTEEVAQVAEVQFGEVLEAGG